MASPMHPLWWGLEKPGQVGVLDWITGVVRINCTVEEWERYLEGIQNDDRENLRFVELAETLSHECYHLLQICSTGYLYSFCMRLFDLVMPSLLMDSPVVDSISPAPETVESVRQLINELHDPGLYGLSPIDVIEGAAFHFQVSHNYLGAPSRFPVARKKLAAAYGLAYEKAAEALGEMAFYFLPLLANHSLLWEHPGNAFVHFARKLSTQLSCGTKVPWTLFMDGPGMRIGLATEIRDIVGLHPIFGDLVDVLEKEVDFHDFFEAPHQAVTLEIAVKVHPVVILDAAHGKRGVWIPPSRSVDSERIEALLILGHRAGIFFNRIGT